jgi:hypothetical protein
MSGRTEPAEPEERDPKKDPMSAHEVMDRSYIVSDIWDCFVAGHEFVAGHPELREKAEAISNLLGEFYQLSGKIALDDDALGKREPAP